MALSILTAAEMARLDQQAIAEYGIPAAELMENAGRGVVSAVTQVFDLETIEKVVLLCGKGNNGGDGFVIARLLHEEHDLVPEVVLVGSTDEVRGEARENLDAVKELELPFLELTDATQLPALEKLLEEAELVFDALLGTGFSGELSGLLADIVARVNTRPVPVVAVDVPSGLDASTGAVGATCIEADLTVTMQLPKRGFMVPPGVDYVGELMVAPIGFPPELLEHPGPRMLVADDAVWLVPNRKISAHKGDNGHLLIIAGSRGMAGAAALATQAALLTGAGLVTTATPESVYPILAAKVTEAMTWPLPETSAGSMAAAALPLILEQERKFDAIALGPGLGRDPETQQLARELVRRTSLPLLVDADALFPLRADERCFERRSAATIITPHPGELARFIDRPVAEIQPQRLEVAAEVSREQQCVVVLKGARTVIASPAEGVYINGTGNSGMGSGGMGDVLTGVVGSLLVQGLSAFKACILGTYAHGLAGDLLCEKNGYNRLLAGQVANHLPTAFSWLSKLRYGGIT